MVLFMTCVGAAALGLVGLGLLATGHSLVPAPTPQTADQKRHRRRLRAATLRQSSLALSAAVVVLAATRWPTAALAAGAIVVLWPRLFGGNAEGKHTLAKIEAIASWTETLRDTSSAAAGLEQALPATVTAAPAVLVRPLRNLAARLDGKVPLPEALALMADEIDDPAVDMVVAALSLNARQRAGGLERILTSLAATTRTELEMRRKVELQRRALRRRAQQIAIAVVGFVSVQAVLARGWVEPYSTPLGQVVLGVLIAIFVGAFARMRSLAHVEAPSRFLTSAAQVTEIASYKPLASATVPRSPLGSNGLSHGRGGRG